MKKPSLLKSALLTLVGVGLLASPAGAATTTYSPDDLFIGFFDKSGEATKDYLVNLGQASAFRDAAPGITLSLGTFGADLDLAFGDGWEDNQNVSWFVFGGTHLAPVGADPNYTLYVSGARNDANTPFAPYQVGATNGQGVVAGQIKGVGNAYFKKNGSVQTLTASGGLLQNTTQSNSLFSQTGVGGTIFGGYDTANFANGTGNSVLDLFRLPGDQETTDPANPIYGRNVGKFTITDAGTVTFKASAVPEPSTYGLIMGAGALLLVAIRRARQIRPA